MANETTSEKQNTEETESTETASTEGQEEAVERQPTDEELQQQHEDLFKEFTEPEPDEEEEEPEPEPRAGQEEQEDESEEEDSTERDQSEKGGGADDQTKADAAVEQIGNKNYIDRELINSIEDKELRQKVWNLANTTQSHYNRLYAREQEYNNLRRYVDELEKEKSQSGKSGQEKQQIEGEISQAREKIKQFKEDYPDLADSIQALAEDTFNEKNKEFTELFERKLSPIEQKMEQESRQAEMQRLDQAAKTIFNTDETGVDYREVVASPDFQAWREQQDPSVQKLIESDNAAEVALVLRQFESDYSRAYREQYGRDWIEDVRANSDGSQAKKTANPPNTTDPEATKQGDEIKEKREKRKQAAVTGVKPGRSGTNTQTDLDEDALFKHFAKQSRYAR